MRGCHLERVKGIEPSYEAWEAAVLPLNYTREAADSTTWKSRGRKVLGLTLVSRFIA